MWDHVHLPYGLEPVIEVAKAGEAIFVTDGSYNRTVRKDVCSAGWVIYSERRKKVVMESSFCETSSSAGSYRGKLLGLLAIHVFIAAVQHFYDLPSTPRGKVACDNLGGLNKARQRRKKVPPRTTHAVILRALRTSHHLLRGKLQYEHVYGHQDQGSCGTSSAFSSSSIANVTTWQRQHWFWVFKATTNAHWLHNAFLSNQLQSSMAVKRSEVSAARNAPRRAPSTCPSLAGLQLPSIVWIGRLGTRS